MNQVHGMVSTKIKFHITSQFTILHYITATGEEMKETGSSVANWETVYKSKSTCLERIANRFAFPFYLAELARAAVPAPPPPPAPPDIAHGRKLLQDGDVYGVNSSYGYNSHTHAFYATSLRDEPYVEMPLRYSPETTFSEQTVIEGSPFTNPNKKRSLLQDDEHGTYDPLTGKTTYVINGQTILVDGNQAGSNTAWGLGLVDITQVNAVDAYTNLPLDNSAKLRIYGDGWVEVLRTTFYVGDRARFFYVAGANCDRLCKTTTCNGDLNIEYEIEFTNGFKWYSKHFSADEIGVLETSIAFSCLYIALGIFYFAVRKELKRIRKHHHTVKILGSSIILAFFSHGAFFLHYIWYSSDGIGYMPLRFIARLLQLSSETTFLLLLILLGKGWTICCRKISARGRVKIAVFGTVYASSWLLAVAYHEFVADKASTLHMYQSGFGYFLCALRFFGLGWFWYSISVTTKKYNSKTGFYKKFALTFALWFYGLPVIVIVAQSLPPWQRFVVVNAMEFSFLFAFQLTLLMMYVPNLTVNKSFPFHATTNETFLHRQDRGVVAVGRNVVSVGGRVGGGGSQKPSQISDWDKKELSRAMQSTRVLTHEIKKISDCLTQLEVNNELESDDEAYDERAVGRRVNSPSTGFGNTSNMNAGGNRPPVQSPSGREYGDGAYPGQRSSGFGDDRSGANSPGPGRAFGQANGQSNGFRNDEERGMEGVSGVGGVSNPGPVRNPLFAAMNQGGSQLQPLGAAASAFGDVANQRSLLARLGKNRGTRPLGSGGYT